MICIVSCVNSFILYQHIISAHKSYNTLCKFLRRKKFKGKTSKVCFVCRRPGHFAKNCPKKEKLAKLLEQAQIHADDTPFSDVESLFSLDDDYSPQVLAGLFHFRRRFRPK